MRRFSIAIVLAFGLGGCGSSIEGVYSGEDTGFLDQIELKGDNQAEVMFMGTIREGTYEIRDDTIRLNVRGDISVLRIDDSGCLEGDGILGRYCKSGAAASGGGASQGGDRQSGNAGLIGERFAAGPHGDQMILDFLDARTVRIEVDGGVENLPYEDRGGNIVIRGMDGSDFVLVSRGQDLEGGPDGMVLVFRRL